MQRQLLPKCISALNCPLLLAAGCRKMPFSVTCYHQKGSFGLQVEPPARASSLAPAMQQTRLEQRNGQYSSSTQPSNGV